MSRPGKFFAICRTPSSAPMRPRVTPAATGAFPSAPGSRVREALRNRVRASGSVPPLTPGFVGVEPALVFVLRRVPDVRLLASGLDAQHVARLGSSVEMRADIG